ncbi:Fibulin-7 [Bagarius yarrelli]|uniref:Fibulin-7 n=1 Tax=Bagarius yarrelli TaxID=175774 RepID=A0A556THP4_BAGYA|nr:Fibulin-7 [Bagarius yarrelli]
MYNSGLFLIIFITCQMFGAQSQECVSRQEVQSALRHVHKLLSAHESSFLQSVRSLRKKLNLLHNTSNISTSENNTPLCQHPNPPANGRMLGQVFKVGHEVHFLCNHGFQLSGPETRECLDSLRWSGDEPTCQKVDAETHNSTSSKPTSSSSSSTPSSSAHVRPSRCVELQDSTHCTCEQGYSISSQDRSLCTDVDECELYRMTQSGRLCLHKCINTAGSYYCQCPSGYTISKDNRGCQDIDECKLDAHNCTKEQVCVNTFGGHRCMVVECPRYRNASYIKTSALQCERNPCVQGNKACLQAPVSISFHFMSVMSNISTPRVLFRVSASRILGNSLRFGLLGNRGTGHFTLQRSSRQSGELLLVEPVQGPATLEAEVEMSELDRRTLLGRYITKVTLFVSQYSF